MAAMSQTDVGGHLGYFKHLKFPVAWEVARLIQRGRLTLGNVDPAKLVELRGSSVEMVPKVARTLLPGLRLHDTIESREKGGKQRQEDHKKTVSWSFSIFTLCLQPAPFCRAVPIRRVG